jgi:hypothetical protein
LYVWPETDGEIRNIIFCSEIFRRGDNFGYFGADVAT